LKAASTSGFRTTNQITSQGSVSLCLASTQLPLKEFNISCSETPAGSGGISLSMATPGRHQLHEASLSFGMDRVVPQVPSQPFRGEGSRLVWSNLNPYLGFHGVRPFRWAAPSFFYSIIILWFYCWYITTFIESTYNISEFHSPFYHCPLSFLPWFLEYLDHVSFFHFHTWVHNISTIFTCLHLFLISCLWTLEPTLRQDLVYVSILFLKNDTFICLRYLCREFHYDISMYIRIISWIGSSLPFLSFLP
jgi:hypothetical protein